MKNVRSVFCLSLITVTLSSCTKMWWENSGPHFLDTISTAAQSTSIEQTSFIETSTSIESNDSSTGIISTTITTNISNPTTEIISSITCNDVSSVSSSVTTQTVSITSEVIPETDGPVISDGGKTITYGYYPQTHVNDSSLISSLESIETSTLNGWYQFNNAYYKKAVAHPYQDNYKFSDGSNIEDGEVYWFEVKPIEWQVLKNESNSYFITTKKLLDAHRYNEFFISPKSITDYQGNTETVYANNYKFSEIRNWLNTNFLSEAFCLNSSHILNTSVDNSPASCGYSSSSYSCADTLDKVFLLSYTEINDSLLGFSNDISRRILSTDYSLCMGGHRADSNNEYVCCNWYFTRSPIKSNSGIARGVLDDGDTDYSIQVGSTSHGIRPAINISI